MNKIFIILLLFVAGCKTEEPGVARIRESYAPPGGWLFREDIEYADGTKKTMFKPVGFSASSDSFRIDWIEIRDKEAKP